MSEEMIHGHGVLELIAEALVLEKFGKEARLYTCSEEGMTFDQLYSFFNSKGIVVIEGGFIELHQVASCSH